MAGRNGPPFPFGRLVNPGKAAEDDSEKIAAMQKNGLKCCFAAYMWSSIEIASNEVKP